MSDSIDILEDYAEENEELSGPKLQLEKLEHEIGQIESQISQLQERKKTLAERRERGLQKIQADQLAPRRDWGQDKFEWDDDVQRVLHDIFKLKGFRQVNEHVCALHGGATGSSVKIWCPVMVITTVIRLLLFLTDRKS